MKKQIIHAIIYVPGIFAIVPLMAQKSETPSFFSEYAASANISHSFEEGFGSRAGFGVGAYLGTDINNHLDMRMGIEFNQTRAFFASV